MLENKKTLQAKTFLEVERRIQELQKKIRQAPRIPLEKKLFVGHWRSYKVRADVLRSSLGLQIQKVVDACNTFRLGKKKDPDSFRGCTEILLDPTCPPIFTSGQHLQFLTKEDYEMLDLSASQKLKWFLERTRTLKVGTKNIFIPKYFPQIPGHMLEFTYKPAYITEVKLPNGDAESELVKLHQFMDTHKGWEKIHGNHKDEWSHSLEKKKILSKLSKQYAREDLLPPL